MRRTVVAALVALSAAGSAPSHGARLPRCLSAPDQRGDGYFASQTLADEHLDIVGASLRVSKGVLSAKFSLAALGDAPRYAWGDRFEIYFTHKTYRIEMFAKNSRTRDGEQVLFDQHGLVVDETAVRASVSSTYDPVRSEVTLRVPIGDLRAAIARSIDGGLLQEISFKAYGAYVARSLLWDRVDAPADFRVAPCT